MVHRANEPPGTKVGALRIIRNVLKGEVVPSAEIKAQANVGNFLKPPYAWFSWLPLA
jgi:hypothetical protein